MKKNYQGWMSVGLVSICLLAIFYMVFIINSVTKITRMTHQIYQHPYQVAGEARAMQTRLYEMKTYLPTLLSADYEDAEIIIQLLKERDALQDASLAKIKELHQGDPVEIDDLIAALRATREARWQAVEACVGHTDLDLVMQYVQDHVNPYSEAEDLVLQRIIASADQRVTEIQAKVVALGRATMTGAFVICVLIVLMAFYSRWRERRKNREITYRQKLFDLLSSHVDDVFYIFNRKTMQIEYTSENSERILGIQAEAFSRDPNILYEYLLSGAKEKIYEIFRNGPLHTSVEREFQCRREEKILDLKVRIYPIQTNGKVERYITVLSDQTEAVAKQQALRDALTSAQSANAAKRNFLSRMSHEIRTPINAIIGMTAIAAHHIEQPERIADCLKKITYSSQYLLALVNDVLDMSKIEDGKLTVNREAFDFRALIESVTSIAYPQTGDRKQNFEVALTGITQETLVGDPLRLNQILLNLLSNAMKFTPSGGEIRLEVTQRNENGSRVFLRFVVRDNGIGMSEEFLPRLYDPFEQADGSSARNSGGAGLGMSITKNLISMMGGSIAVQSAPGEGTEFTVELPFETITADAARAAGAKGSFAKPFYASSLDHTLLPASHGGLDIALAEPPIAEENDDFSGRKILLVEDNELNLEIAEEILKMAGLQVDCAQNGALAVNAFLQSGEAEYALILMDVQMPVMNGYDATRTIRASAHPAAKSMPIIAMTANAFCDDVSAAREAGMNGHIAKPIDIAALYRTIALHLRTGS